MNTKENLAALATLYAFAIETYKRTKDFELVQGLACHYGLCHASLMLLGYDYWLEKIKPDHVKGYWWELPFYFMDYKDNITALQVRYEFLERKIEELSNPQIFDNENNTQVSFSNYK